LLVVSLTILAFCLYEWRSKSTELPAKLADGGVGRAAVLSIGARSDSGSCARRLKTDAAFVGRGGLFHHLL
jgi:hypothetical protein